MADDCAEQCVHPASDNVEIIRQIGVHELSLLDSVVSIYPDRLLLQAGTVCTGLALIQF